jgi:hypothetical protein
MIADYLRGPGPRAGHLGRLKSSHVLNIISSIKLKNKTFIFFSIKGKGGPTPTLFCFVQELTLYEQFPVFHDF